MRDRNRDGRAGRVGGERPGSRRTGRGSPTDGAENSGTAGASHRDTGRPSHPSPYGIGGPSHSAAHRAVTDAVRRAESTIDAIMDTVSDRRSREEISEAIATHTAAHGEPRFRIDCYRCGEPVVDLPLIYPSARGLWTWMPPLYYVARFNADEDQRRCAACGTVFPLVNPASG